MNEFYEKWKSDKKYRTKVNLIAYTAFVAIVSLYALSLNNKIPNTTSSLKDDIINKSQTQADTIDIPINYTYKTTINIDDEIYVYNGEKNGEDEKITKENNGIITNYRYANNEYYELTDDVYQLTTKENIYDNVNYNYINLSNINKYLSKAQKNNNEYTVYLKDIILGNESSNYFTIVLDENHINIDYTPLIKEFDHNINKYLVDIVIENN